MNKNGLVLGRFEPFTMGHKFLIDSAAQNCEKLIVLVCTLETESIEGYIRYNWVNQTYLDNDNVTVIHVTDDLPQEPRFVEDDVFWQIWTDIVLKYSTDINVFFSSELYGDEMVRWMNKLHNKDIIHHCVDIKREVIPVSGTKVRNNPFKMWNFLPDNVKEYFGKKVAILGPESVGKSTMVKKLAHYFNTNYVEEYGRTYGETVKNPNEFDSSDFMVIAKVHDQIVKNSIKHSNGVSIVDTEAMTTKIFGEMYLDDFDSTYIDKVIEAQDFDLYLLLNADVPWVDDGLRDFPEGREDHFNRIKEELEKNGKKYVVISGADYMKRNIQAVVEIEKLYKYNL